MNFQLKAIVTTSLENADLSFIFRKVSFNVQINTKGNGIFQTNGKISLTAFVFIVNS